MTSEPTTAPRTASHRPAASLAGGARGVEIYTRISLYLFVPLEGFFYLYAVVALAEHDPLPSAVALGALAVAALVHIGTAFATVHVGFDRPLVAGGRLHPVVIALLVATAAVVVLALVVLPGAPDDALGRDARALTIAVCGAATCGALATGFAMRTLTVVALWVPVVVLVTWVLDGSFSGGAVVGAVFLYALVLFWTGTVRISMWIVEVVRELEASREVAGRLAVAEERLRISRDMHDVVGRALSAVAVKSDLSAALARRGDPRAAEEMDEVRTLAQESLREVRGVVAGYRSTDLATELAGARSVLRAAGIAVRVIGAVPPLGTPQQEALAWVVREAVTNVVRHSRATECRLELDDDGATTELRIVNDGVVSGGPDAAGLGEPRVPGGTGLAGLRERLAAAGGTLDVAAHGDRFTVVARVPNAPGAAA
ncbi:sensor histidine kinase [Isoptericola sp. S6320L]|uniref:sensor histidine kinase n=1 Tax=Isoptericola sp. S6320L TaxID=2926411 RepID=UPI001FF1830D|nr:sensor histidine kinase [Isoptericola sp. S6320L]MCK0116410.1 sensor histidine kinase [Isoptericola sp. S6320L]